MVWIIIAVVLVVIGFIWMSIYNRLVKQRNWVDESFSQIDVQLKRRNDLIPNIVETVKGYTNHERETLEAVTNARQQMMNLPTDASPEEINAMSNQLSGALSRLLAVAESYPELKANQNFNSLQNTLEDTENKIAQTRMLYNSSIQQYNTGVQSFPNNIVAGVHGFTERVYLETPAEDRQVPEVNFS